MAGFAAAFRLPVKLTPGEVVRGACQALHRHRPEQRQPRHRTPRTAPHLPVALRADHRTRRPSACDSSSDSAPHVPDSTAARSPSSAVLKSSSPDARRNASSRHSADDTASRTTSNQGVRQIVGQRPLQAPSGFAFGALLRAGVGKPTRAAYSWVLQRNQGQGGPRWRKRLSAKRTRPGL